MKFKDEQHKEFYENCMKKAKKDDCYRRALFFVLGLSQNCADNIDSLYDFEENYILPEDLGKHDWITETDAQLIRLAFNLYGDNAPTAFGIENSDDKALELSQYLTTSIFRGLDSDLMEQCFEGIRIRFMLVR